MTALKISLNNENNKKFDNLNKENSEIIIISMLAFLRWMDLLRWMDEWVSSWTGTPGEFVPSLNLRPADLALLGQGPGSGCGVPKPENPADVDGELLIHPWEVEMTPKHEQLYQSGRGQDPQSEETCGEVPRSLSTENRVKNDQRLAVIKF